MPMYFFHIRHHDRVDEDIEGVAFPDLLEAKADAERCLREIIAFELRDAQEVDIVAMDITDHVGNVLVTVTVEEAVLKPLGSSGAVDQS